ncbi:Jag N-terminal domain-containing protein [Candidatus Babeliales bacterium]|nr:Jag N-terminal domain-containing protein [Candidatus Babeliales bacterium]
MKLMLQEASSVIKAIEKVWENSGKPQEFSIKILEFGEKNFLGLTKKPAVISISYDPKKQQIESPSANLSTRSTAAKEIVKNKEKAAEQRPTSRPFNKEQRGRFGSKDGYDDGGHQQTGRKDFQVEAWNDDYVKDISAWISDILKIMNIDLKFNVKIENKILKVLIDKRILKEDEEEKMFFIGLSHLLMQFLKKKYKKKLKNYYLIIHSKIPNTFNSNGAK